MTLNFIPPPEAVPTINVMYYGPPKTGKTTGAASAPGPILYLNADLPTATRFARLRHGDKVCEVQYEGFVPTLVGVMKAVEDGEFKTVVVDPLGELYRLMLEEVSDRAIRPKINEYGDVGVQLERFCRGLCKAPVNAVFIAHDHPVKDEASGDVLQLPWTGTGNPKLGRNIMGMVDIIGYTGAVEKEDGTVEYVAQLIPARGRTGGDRFNVLGKSRPVDLTEWIDVIAADAAATKE